MFGQRKGNGSFMFAVFIISQDSLSALLIQDKLTISRL